MEYQTLINNLHTKIYYPEQAINQIIIGIHGFGGDKESSVLIKMAESLKSTNIALLTYDLPCHGENENNKSLSLKDCLNSVKEVYEYVKSNYAGIPISFFATSFGGYLLLNFLQENEINLNKIILRAPAIKMAKVIKDVILPEHGFSVSDLNTNPVNVGYEKECFIDARFVEELQEYDLNKNYNKNYFLNVLQGKKDTTVNPADNEEFFNAKCINNYKIYYFEEADHRFKGAGEIERIIEITKQILGI